MSQLLWYGLGHCQHGKLYSVRKYIWCFCCCRKNYLQKKVHNDLPFWNWGNQKLGFSFVLIFMCSLLHSLHHFYYHSDILTTKDLQMTFKNKLFHCICKINGSGCSRCKVFLFHGIVYSGRLNLFLCVYLYVSKMKDLQM